jgi:hypothetical protein
MPRRRHLTRIAIGPSGILLEVTTLQQERDGALAAYRAACAEFEQAQQSWDPFLAVVDAADMDSAAAEAAFERLRKANQARQDALDSLWLAWRNRPDTE